MVFTANNIIGLSHFGILHSARSTHGFASITNNTVAAADNLAAPPQPSFCGTSSGPKYAAMTFASCGVFSTSSTAGRSESLSVDDIVVSLANILLLYCRSEAMGFAQSAKPKQTPLLLTTDGKRNEGLRHARAVVRDVLGGVRKTFREQSNRWES